MGKAMSTARDQYCDMTWSDLHHDVLFQVMMRLGFVDFLAFSRGCKSWRSLALSNWKRFIASRPPMSMRISPCSPMVLCKSPCADTKSCHLKDFKGRMFKTILPHSAGRSCVGVTSGHLIFFGQKTNDFWLVNPITMHQLHFPRTPLGYYHLTGLFRAILVFSPSISAWLFVFLTKRYSNEIWFSRSGTRIWNHVSAIFPIFDLHTFRGKIYTITNNYTRDVSWLWEMSLDPPKLTLLKTRNFPNACCISFVSSGEKLYVIPHASKDLNMLHELDFDEMKWVCLEKTKQGYAFYSSKEDGKIAAVKRNPWWPGTNRKRNKNQEGRLNMSVMWYFPHECLHVNLIMSDN